MKYFLVGTLFMIGLFFSFYFTIVERADTKGKYPYKLNLYLPKADGFREGDGVYLRGLLFGEISEIRKVAFHEVKNPRFELTPDLSAVELTLMVKNPITLWDNYRVQFKTKTLFSTRHLDIDPGFPDGELTLKANPFADDTPSTDYTDDLFTIAYDVLKDNRSDLRRIVTNTHSITSKLKGTNGTLPKLVNEEELYDSAEHFVYDISIVSKEARRYIENQRETDINPITFTMVIFFNLMGFSILSN